MLTANFPVNSHFRLRDALAARRRTLAVDRHSRVWAFDHRRDDGTVAKIYEVHNMRHFATIMQCPLTKPNWWAYEVILEGDEARLFLDIELSAELDGTKLREMRTKGYLHERLRHMGLPEVVVEAVVDEYIHVVQQPLTDLECFEIYWRYRQNLQQFLMLQDSATANTANTANTGVVYLSSCRRDKFSLHIIHPNMIFDRAWLSMKYFVWEFCRFLWEAVNEVVKNKVEQAIGDLTDDPEINYQRGQDAAKAIPISLLRMLLLHRQYDEKGWKGVGDTGVDEVVYRKNQLFRLVGNCKFGTEYPLVVIPEDKEKAVRFRYTAKRRMRPHDFTEELLKATVVVPDGIYPLVRCIPTPECRHFLSIKLAYPLVHGADMEEENSAPVYQIKVPHREVRKGPRMVNFSRAKFRKETIDQRRVREADLQAPKATKVVDDNKIFLRADDMKPTALYEMEIGDTLFHDCPEESSGEGTDGIPSAYLMRGAKEDSKLLWCWACNTGFFVLPTYQSPRYEFPELSCHTRPYKNRNGEITKMDQLPHEQMMRKLVLLDGPCGCGKTYQITKFNADVYGGPKPIGTFPDDLQEEGAEEGVPGSSQDSMDLEESDERAVCAPYYRKALAITNAPNYGLNCYTAIKGARGDTRWKRVAVCLNSVVRIPADLLTKYDLVIIDEAGFLRRHFVSENMLSVASQCYWRLQTIVKNAQTVIVAQFDLHERDVEFYANMRNVNMYDQRHVFAYKFRWSDMTPRKILVTRDEKYLLFRLMEYVSAISPANPKKVLVLMTSVHRAIDLGTYLEQGVDTGRLNLDRSRIKVVTCNSQVRGWEAKFLTNPNKYAADFDVLVVTPTLQAGQSLDGNINKIFGCFYQVLTHDGECQFLHRARPHPNMEDPEIFVQPGCGGRELASYDAQLHVLSRTMPNAELAKAAADVEAEIADSNNRRYWLYKEDPMWDVHDLEAPSEPSEVLTRYQQFKQNWRSYVSQHGVGGKTESTMYAYVDHNRDPDTMLDILEKDAYGSFIANGLTPEKTQAWDFLYNDNRTSKSKVRFQKNDLLELFMYYQLPPGSILVTRGKFGTKGPVLNLCSRVLASAVVEQEGTECQTIFGIPVDTPFLGQIPHSERLKLYGTPQESHAFQAVVKKTPGNYESKPNCSGLVLHVLKRLRIPYEVAGQRRIGGSRVITYKVTSTKMDMLLSLMVTVFPRLRQVYAEMGITSEPLCDHDSDSDTDL
jgi:hypothetical protein